MRGAYLLYLAGVLFVMMGLLAVPATGMAAYGDHLYSITSGNLNQPAKVAVDPLTGFVYVTDAGGKAVKRYSSSGTYDSGFSLSVAGTPVGIATNGTNIFVGDDTNDCVWIYDMDGNLADLISTGSSHKLGGASGTRMGMPSTVCCAPSGHIFVVNGDNDKIRIYNYDGTLDSSFCVSGPGTSTGTTIYVNYPTGIAMANYTEAAGVRTQYFYIGDQSNTRVQKLYYAYNTSSNVITTAPTYVSSIGSKGDAFGQFLRPADLVWDSNNSRLIVVDSLQMVGQEFNSSGGTLSAALNYSSGVQGYLNVPTGIAIGAGAQKAYVASNQSDSLEIFSTDLGIPKPTVTVNTPATGLSYSTCAERSFSINFTTTDADSPSLTTYFFADTDTSWYNGPDSTTPGTGEYLIRTSNTHTGAPGTYNKTWDLAFMPPGTYYVRALAVDEVNNKAEDYSAGTVTITDTGDGDGLNDIFEDCYGNVTPGSDDDNDGLTALQEQSIGTNPTNPDTDSGGVRDGIEVNSGSDPLITGDDYFTLPDVSMAWFIDDGSAAGGYVSYIVLKNISDSTVLADLTFYNSNSTPGLIKTESMSFAPQEVKQIRASSLSGMTALKGGMVLRSTVNDKLIGYGAYDWVNTVSGNVVDFAFNSVLFNQKDLGTTLYNPWFIDQTYGPGTQYVSWLTLSNPNNTSVSATLYWYGVDGIEKAQTPITLLPHQVYAKRPSGLFTTVDRGTLKVVADAKLCGYITRFWKNGSNASIMDFGFSNRLLATPGYQTLYNPGFKDALGNFVTWHTVWNTSNSEVATMIFDFDNYIGTHHNEFSAGQTLNPNTSTAKRPVNHQAAGSENNLKLSTTGGSLLAYGLEFEKNAVDSAVMDYANCANLVPEPLTVAWCPLYKANVADSVFTGTYQTELVLMNPDDIGGTTVLATLYFYDTSGTLVHTENDMSFAPRTTVKLNPATYVGGSGEGSIKIVTTQGVGLIGRTDRKIMNASTPSMCDEGYSEELLAEP